MTSRTLKHRAHVEVAGAIKRGKLPRPDTMPCTDCGRMYTADGPRHEYDHHLGYAREHWLSVQAVCKHCHAKRTVSRPDWREKKPSPGRKPLPGGREKFTTTLPGYVVRHLRKDGNASAKIIAYVEQELAEQQTISG